MSDYVEQPDGRMVAGPRAPEWDKPPPHHYGIALLLVLFGMVAVLSLGAIFGRSTAPTPAWQTLYGQRIVEGCLPQVLVLGTGKEFEADRLHESADRAIEMINNTYQDVHRIAAHVLTVPPGSGLRQKNPNAELVAVVTLERCL